MKKEHKGGTVHNGYESYGGHKVCRHTLMANRVSPECHMSYLPFILRDWETTESGQKYMLRKVVF